jgi:hypothetical protein
MQTLGTRYDGCDATGAEKLKHALESGRKLIQEWLKDFNKN